MVEKTREEEMSTFADGCGPRIGVKIRVGDVSVTVAYIIRLIIQVHIIITYYSPMTSYVYGIVTNIPQMIRVCKRVRYLL